MATVCFAMDAELGADDGTPGIEWATGSQEHRVERGPIAAFAELCKSGGRYAWKVPVCPYCGQTHVHDAGEYVDETRAHLGVKSPLCEEIDKLAHRPQPEERYELIQADSGLARRLRNLANLPKPYYVVDKHNLIVSEHRTLWDARLAAWSAPRSYGRMRVVNLKVRLLEKMLYPEVFGVEPFDRFALTLAK